MKEIQIDATKSKMGFSEALSIVNSLPERINSEGMQEKYATALLTLKWFEELIVAPALKAAEKAAQEKMRADDSRVTVSSDLSVVDQKTGEIKIKHVSLEIGPVETSKTVYDFERIKKDRGVSIENDSTNPLQKIIKVSDAADWDLFKSPSLNGNPTTVAAAIAAGKLSKQNYEQVKKTVSYETQFKATEVQ